MTIIQKIEQIMKEKGITRYQIEKELNIKQSTFKNWVNGTEPGVEKIIKLLKYLEVSADDLFELGIRNLTEEEQELIAAYRNADQRGKRNIMRIAKDEAAEQQSSTSKIG